MKDDIPQLKFVIRKPLVSGKGKCFVLNDALALLTGEIIWVFDADTKICLDFLEKIVAYVEDPEIGYVQSIAKMHNKEENYLSRIQHVEFASFENILRDKDNLGKTGFLVGNSQLVKKQSIIDSVKWDEFAAIDELKLAVKIMFEGGKIFHHSQYYLKQRKLIIL